MFGEVRDVSLAMPWGVLALKTWNSENLEPFLLVHGACDNAGSFDTLVPLLSPDYHYVCVDLPGHGLSSGLTAGLPLSFMSFVSALQRLVRHFGWASFSLMGHSFGAHLALILAAAERKKVKRLILLDGSVRTFISDSLYLIRCTTELEELLEQEEKHYSRPCLISYEDALEKLKTRSSPVTERVARALLARTLVKTGKGYYSLEDPRKCFTILPHMSENVHKYNCSIIPCPVLVVYARKSPLFPVHNSPYFEATLKILMETHHLSRVEVVEGDHCVHCNQPDVVAPKINTFLHDTKNVHFVKKCKI